jgi:hypothetical protein
MRGGISGRRNGTGKPLLTADPRRRSDQLELAGAEDGFAAAGPELVSDSLLLMPRRHPA